MKFAQSKGFVPEPCSHFVQTPTPYPLISTTFRICIRKPSSPPKTSSSLSSDRRWKCLTTKLPSFSLDFPAIQFSTMKTTSLFHLSAIHIPLIAAVSFPLTSFAAGTEETSARINVESFLVSVDGFFNRYPYFVASLAFVWLVVAPLTKEYLNKYKNISCLDAFRKLRDDPNTQLLDIRKNESVRYLRTPNLKIFDKDAVGVEFVEGCEEEFVKKVLMSFRDPGSTILCVLDNLDGNSLKVAKLLFENGFKEVYAMKGGMLGEDGWQAIQGTLLPPSLHVYPTKKGRQSSDQVNGKQEGNSEEDGNMQLLNSSSKNQEIIENTENGSIQSRKLSPEAKNFQGRPLSPYPNYADFKPPSSPTPYPSLNMQLLNSSRKNQEIIENAENGYIQSRKTSSTTIFQGRPLSPYPNYADLKPPSSPTPYPSLNMQLLNSSSKNQEIIENAENGRKTSSTVKNFQGRPLSPYPNYADLKPPSSPTPSNSQG